MNRTPRLGSWWPLVFGATIGVELVLSAFILFGPVRLTPEAAAQTAAQLTDRGRYLFSPEREVPIYLAGCALAALLIGGLAWLWQQRFARVTDDDREDFIRRGSGELVLALGVFALHLALFLAVRRYVIAMPHFLWSFHGLDAGPVPLFAVVLLAAPPLGSLLIAFIGPSWNLRLAPRWLVSCLGARSTEKPPATARLRGPDLLVPLLLCAIIYVPDWRHRAGEIFLAEQFFHWDFFAMGPALAFHHGQALGTEAYSLYGVGWPMLFHALSGWIPITYGRFIQVAVIYGCLYFIGVYLLLRLMGVRPVWAAAGVLLALSVQLFFGVVAGKNIWDTPSSTMMRCPTDIWFFIALWRHLRTGRAGWALAAGACVGLAVLFGTDAGISLAVVFAAYWFFSLGLDSSRTTAERAEPAHPQQATIAKSRFGPPRADGPRSATTLPGLSCLASWLTTAVVVLVGLAIASRGTLLRAEFWAGWLEPLRTFTGALYALPIVNFPNRILLLLALVLCLYVGTMGMALSRLFRRESTPAVVFLGCLAAYGLLMLIRFVGRSSPDNLIVRLGPLCLIATVVVAALHQQFVAHRPTNVAAGRGWQRIAASLLPWGALAGVLIAMAASPAFQKYPGTGRTILSGSPGVGLCLLPNPRDACGLPEDNPDFNGDYIREFHATVSNLRARAAAGQSIAVLDAFDTMYYLAANIPPWGRYSPVFSGILRRAELDALQRTIAAQGPECVLIPGGGDSDVWHAAHQAVEQHYRLEGTNKLFQFWRRMEQ